jgi:hypothetical protein
MKRISWHERFVENFSYFIINEDGRSSGFWNKLLQTLRLENNSHGLGCGMLLYKTTYCPNFSLYILVIVHIETPEVYDSNAFATSARGSNEAPRAPPSPPTAAAVGSTGTYDPAKAS